MVDARNDTATKVSQVQDRMTQGIDAFTCIVAKAAATAAPTRQARDLGLSGTNVARIPANEAGDTVIGGEGENSSRQVCSVISNHAGGRGKIVIIHGPKAARRKSTAPKAA